MSYKWILKYFFSYLLLFFSFGYTYYWDSKGWNLILLLLGLNIIGWLLYYKLWNTANNKKRQYFIMFYSFSMILFLIPAIYNMFIEKSGSLLEYSIFMIILVFLFNIIFIYKDINNKKIIIENIISNIQKEVAIKEYKKALKYANKLKYKNLSVYYYIKGNIYLSVKNNKKAKLYLRIAELLTLCSSNKFIKAKIYNELANSFIKDNQIDKAISISIKALKNYKKANGIEEEYYQCLHKIAVLYYKQEKYLKAIPYLEKLINNQSYLIKKDYLLGCIYYQLNDITKAENLFLNLLNKKSNNESKIILDIYYWLVKIYSKKGEGEKKIDFLFKGISEDEGFYVSYKWPTYTFNTCENKQIYNYFKEKYLNNELSIKLFNSLIYLSYKLNREEKFIEYISLMEKYYPEHIDVTYWKIIDYIKHNDFDQAKVLYRSVVSKEPEFYAKYTWEETKYDPDKIKAILEVEG